MCGGALDTVSVIDSSFTGFVIHVKILKVVIEIYGSSTEVTA
jgi:hypothetical protein